MDTRSVHFTLQGRGGVGKSLASALLAQYLVHTERAVSCYDTDPVNNTFTGYEALTVKRIDILGTDNRINARAFDGLIDALLWDDNIAVIDNGASTFVPLMAYLAENRVVDLLTGSGRPVVIHSVLTGGQAFNDTRHGLEIVLQEHSAPVVVWLNEYFGPVERQGRTFLESSLYERNAERIKGIVRLGRGNGDTFGKDLEIMLERKLTFAQAIESPDFGIMPRQRLSMIRAGIFDQLAVLEL
ncbi:CobQ/CobB/MinD/ParA family nucleotide binding protein [Pseudoduganella lurida]|uniref:CobQ/CobB/MinD/ParA family nucleotide binding protein n=1 Tax=Pseudoduganella lurida TaxID=1036180 RepID=A0A562RJL2_9BURK|nr:conjugal transfer protein TraL [Pseudoduganella lurida]TWI69262.1 CobQ/CobB/MinD/ParA family nucleotide binding protein [Pseudoduganella lurida]